jgi:putative flippase GtrA
MINNIVSIIHNIIDWFYPPFKKLMPKQTFRYAACGGGNVLLDFSIYTISYTFLFNQSFVETPWLTITPHIASFLLAFCISFPLGYFLNRYVVFDSRDVRKREQLPKYFAVSMVAFLINYFCLKVFVETFELNAIVARVITIVVAVAFSYYAQKHFTFK